VMIVIVSLSRTVSENSPVIKIMAWPWNLG